MAVLMTKVSKPVTDFLSQSVKVRGMQRYLSHEIISKDLLTPAFSSGVNALEHWRDQLRNDDEVATCMRNYVSGQKEVVGLVVVLCCSWVCCWFWAPFSHATAQSR